MVAIERLTGTAYAGDKDYDAFYGRLVGEYTVKHVDKSRNCTVWTTFEVIDLGRADRPVVADADAQLAPETLDYDLHITAAAAAGIKRAKAEREAALLPAIEACLQEHGPLSTKQLRKKLGGIWPSRLIDLMRKHPDKFKYLPAPRVWALDGQEYVAPKRVARPTKLALAIRAALETHGPQTASEIAARLGKGQTTVTNSIAARPECFRVVEIRAGKGHVPATRVWGLT